MIVNVEFLGYEPIENVITCMNYMVDKVICFGYQETLHHQKANTDKFLKGCCGVKEVEFFDVPCDNLLTMVDIMRTSIQKELSQGNSVFFDITGGESLILVAFGMLSKELNTPMHMYKVEKNELLELNSDDDNSIDKIAKKQSRKFDVYDFISMSGGKITQGLREGSERLCARDFEQDVNALWEVASRYKKYWNPFSDFMRKYMAPAEDLSVDVRESDVVAALNSSTNALKSQSKLNGILNALAFKEILKNYQLKDGRYRFAIKNPQVKEWIWKSGSVLELFLFFREKGTSDDCISGVSIDWDGIVHLEPSMDVHNEIDLLTLKGNTLTFISCKSGKMTRDNALHAMYELETVTKRFGGKYSRKVLAIVGYMPNTYRDRAEEMGIEIWDL